MNDVDERKYMVFRGCEFVSYSVSPICRKSVTCGYKKRTKPNTSIEVLGFIIMSMCLIKAKYLLLY